MALRENSLSWQVLKRYLLASLARRWSVLARVKTGQNGQKSSLTDNFSAVLSPMMTRNLTMRCTLVVTLERIPSVSAKDTMGAGRNTDVCRSRCHWNAYYKYSVITSTSTS